MRNYKRKTQGWEVKEEKIEEALTDIRLNKLTVKEASTKHGIKYCSLMFRKKRAMVAMGGEWEDAAVPTRMGLKTRDRVSKHSSRQIFSCAEEDQLADYLLTCSKLNYGLTIDATRKLAYSQAVFLQRKFPESWERDKKAGKDWSRSFLKRHRQISLRKPENTSLARNVSFNRESLTTYFDNLETLTQQHAFEPSRIWNLDETGLSTVLQAPRVLAPTDARQVGQCVSNERGCKISIVGIINASGGYIPPVYLFPRKRIHMEYMEGAPDGAIALFNSSGYMDSENFLKTLDHIISHTAPSKTDPILLILDNHGSHTSLEAIRKCRENGIHMLTLPPHTSHRTQPLDISVFGPFKSYCKTAFNNWLTENPGQKITFYNIVRVSSNSILKSFSTHNICSGFAKCGVHPLDRSKLLQEVESKENASRNTSAVKSQVSLDASTSSVNINRSRHTSAVKSQVSLDASTSSANPFQISSETSVTINEEFDLTMPTYSPELLPEFNLEDDVDINMDSNYDDRNTVEIPTIPHTNNPIQSPLHLSTQLIPMRSSSPYGEEQPLDLTVRHKNRYEVQMTRKRPLSMIDGPLDLSRPSISYSQLRFGGLEIIRPLPNPLAFQKTSTISRQGCSTIMTGSPEMKKKEEQNMKKNIKKEEQNMKKKIKKEKQELKENLKKEKKETEKSRKKTTAQKRVEDELPKRKRGRPMKTPFCENVGEQKNI